MHLKLSLRLFMTAGWRLETSGEKPLGLRVQCCVSVCLCVWERVNQSTHFGVCVCVLEGIQVYFWLMAVCVCVCLCLHRFQLLELWNEGTFGKVKACCAFSCDGSVQGVWMWSALCGNVGLCVYYRSMILQSKSFTSCGGCWNPLTKKCVVKSRWKTTF